MEGNVVKSPTLESWQSFNGYKHPRWRIKGSALGVPKFCRGRGHGQSGLWPIYHTTCAHCWPDSGFGLWWELKRAHFQTTRSFLGKIFFLLSSSEFCLTKFSCSPPDTLQQLKLVFGGEPNQCVAAPSELVHTQLAHAAHPFPNQFSNLFTNTSLDQFLIALDSHLFACMKIIVSWEADIHNRDPHSCPNELNHPSLNLYVQRNKWCRMTQNK